LAGRNVVARRTLIAAPKEGDGPLMERRGDRELPDVGSSRKWLRTVPIFLAILGACTLAIFNYQKSSSSVVASTLYALRTSSKAREYLGDEICFAHQIPWIWGEMNQLHGRIKISFEVKGNKNKGTMRFASHRAGGPRGVFETTEWSLERSPEAGGGKIDLLDDSDAFRAIEVTEHEKKAPGRGIYSPNQEA